MKRVREDGACDADLKGWTGKEEDSSDDDLWEEKLVPDNKAVIDMEVDVQDRESPSLETMLHAAYTSACDTRVASVGRQERDAR